MVQRLKSRRSGGEAVFQANELGEFATGGELHEVFQGVIDVAMRNSTRIKRPSLQTGQRFGASIEAEGLSEEWLTMKHERAASNARQWWSFCARTRLARKPN